MLQTNNSRFAADAEQIKPRQPLSAIIGIDPEADYSHALNLTARLGFSRCKITLVSVVEPLLMPMGYQADAMMGPVYDDQIINEVQHYRTEHAKKALGVAQELLQSQGIQSDVELRRGFAGSELLSIAEQEGADLLVTACAHEGRFRCAFLNSVSRAAVIAAHESVLVAKDQLAEGQPLNAVLAVDHSDYCLRGFERFLQFQPVGIRKITVLTALRGGFSENRMPVPNLSSFGKEAEAWREETLKAKCYEICDELSKLRIQAEPLLIDAAPADAIEQAMAATQSQLLIMAAHGHGFFERAMLGSLSLHEVVARRHSVLILRP